MNQHKPFMKLIASAVVFTFVVTSLGIQPNAFAAAVVPASQSPGPKAEITLPYQARLDSSLGFSVPSELGSIEYFRPGKGPTLVHIQTAHGHYQAQKQIQALLHHLDNSYGIKTLFVEGSAFELNSEIIRFFPKDHALTMKAADELTRRALIKGPELYLLEAQGAKAYGIEELKSYRQNGIDFVKVLEAKQETQNFLADMNIGIERLSSHYLNKELRDFLRRVESFEGNRIPFEDWLTYLKEQSSKQLEMDLGDTGYQVDWPMMVRIFKIRDLAKKFDLQAYPKEKALFLKAISRISRSTYTEVETLLNSSSLARQLPDPETSLLFEDMVRQLPANFDYKAFPNVRYFIGTLLLQSELKAPALMNETEKLVEKISAKLTRSKEEKKLLDLLKDYRLLGKLFALELLPKDYEAILARRGSMRPSAILPRFLELNNTKRVKDVTFGHVAEMDALFDKAMRFYAGVKARDIKMEERIEEQLKQTGAQKVAVITGGFHSQPFQDHFTGKDFSYALISPKLTAPDQEGYEAYIQSMLQLTLKSTYERASLALTGPQLEASGVNVPKLGAEVRQVLAGVSSRAETRQDGAEKDSGKPHFPKGGKRFTSLEGPEVKEKSVESWRADGEQAFYEDVDEALLSVRSEARRVVQLMAIAVAAVLGFVASARAQIANVVFNVVDRDGVSYGVANTNPVPILMEKLTIQWFNQLGDKIILASNQVANHMVVPANVVAPPGSFILHPATVTNETQITVKGVSTQVPLLPTNSMIAAESSTNDWGYSAASGQDVPSGFWTTNGQVITYPAPTNKEEWAEFNPNLPTGGAAVSGVIVEVTIPTGMVVRVVGMANTGIIGAPALVGTGQPQFVHFAISPYPTSPKGGEQYLQSILFVRNPDGSGGDPSDGDLPGVITVNGIWRVMRSESRKVESNPQTARGASSAASLYNNLMFAALLSPNAVLQEAAKNFFRHQIASNKGKSSKLRSETRTSDEELINQIVADIRSNIKESPEFVAAALQNHRGLLTLELNYYDIAQEIYQTLARAGMIDLQSELFFSENHGAISQAFSRSEARSERDFQVSSHRELIQIKAPDGDIERFEKNEAVGMAEWLGLYGVAAEDNGLSTIVINFEPGESATINLEDEDAVEQLNEALQRSEARTEEEERALSVDVLLGKLPQDVINKLKEKGFQTLGDILKGVGDERRKGRTPFKYFSFLDWMTTVELLVAVSRHAPISYAKVQEIRITKSRSEVRESSEDAVPFRQELLPKYLEYTPRKNRLNKENLKTLAIGDYIFLAPKDPNSIKIVTGFEDAGVFLAKVSPDGLASGAIKTSFKPSALMGSKFILASELPALNELLDQVGRSEARLTDAQEKQFQRAVKDLQSKWWDSGFNGHGVERKLVAIKVLGEFLDFRRAVPVLIWALENIEASRVKASAATALGDIDDPRVAPALLAYHAEKEARAEAERLAAESESRDSDDEQVSNTGWYPGGGGAHSFIPLPMLALAMSEIGITDRVILSLTAGLGIFTLLVVAFIARHLDVQIKNSKEHRQRQMPPSESSTSSKSRAEVRDFEEREDPDYAAAQEFFGRMYDNALADLGVELFTLPTSDQKREALTAAFAAVGEKYGFSLATEILNAGSSTVAETTMANEIVASFSRSEMRQEFKVGLQENDKTLRIFRNGVFQRDIDLTRKNAANQIAKYLQEVFRESRKNGRKATPGSHFFAEDGKVNFEGNDITFNMPVEIADAERIQEWLNWLVLPAGRSEARAVLEKEEAMRLLDERIGAAAGSEIAGHLENARNFLKNKQGSLENFFPQTWWGWKNVIGNQAAFEAFASASGKYASEKPHFKNHRDASDHLERVERQCQIKLGEMKASLSSDPNARGIIAPILAKIHTNYPRPQPRPRTIPANIASSGSFLRIITAMEETAALQLKPVMESARGSLNTDQFRTLEEIVALELAGIRLQRIPFYTTRLHIEAGDWQLPLSLDEWMEFIGDPKAAELFNAFMKQEEKRVAESASLRESSWVRSEARDAEKQWLEGATERFIRIVRDRGVLSQMSPGDTSRAFSNLFYGQFSHGMAQEIQSGKTPRETASRLIQPTHEAIKGFLAFLPSSSWKEFLDYLERLATFIVEEKRANRETRSMTLPWWNFADASLELQNKYPTNTSRESFFGAYLEKYLAYHGYQATPAWSVAFTRSFLSSHKKHTFYDLNAQLGTAELKRLAGEGSIVSESLDISRSEVRKNITPKQLDKMAQTLAEYLDAPDLREEITKPRFRVITDPRSGIELREITIPLAEITKLLGLGSLAPQELKTVFHSLLSRMNDNIQNDDQQSDYVPPFTIPDSFFTTQARGARSELRNGMHHLRAAKSPQEVGHYLAELLTAGKMNSQDKAILGKALEAEFGSAKTVKPAPKARSKARIVLMAVMFAAAALVGLTGCESSSSDSEPSSNIDLSTGQVVPVQLQAYGGGVVSGNQFTGGAESAAVVRENLSGGSMNIVLSVGAGEVIVGPVMPGQISGNTLNIELQTSGGSSDLGQDAPHPDWKRVGPGTADFFLSIPQGAIGVFYLLPAGGSFTIDSMIVYEARAEVRNKEDIEETGIGATLSGFEPVEKKLARAKRPQEIPAKQPGIIQSAKKIIRLFASDIPAGQEKSRRSEMRLDEASFAEGVTRIKAMYEYIMALTQGLTPEDVKVTFDHPYTEIVKVEGQPDQKIKKTVPVTLELFIPKPTIEGIKEVKRVIEIEQNSWRTMNGVEIPEEDILERIFGNEATGNPPDPIVVARVNRQIEGGIYMSFESLAKFPETYKGAQHTLSPKESDDVVDFSVFTERATSTYQLFPVLAKSTIAFAQMYGIDKVVPYSRSEPFSRHIANNPRFQGPEYRNKKGAVDAEKVFAAFARFVTKRGHSIEQGISFEDYRKFFRIDVGSMDPAEAKQIIEKVWKELDEKAKKKSPQGSGPTLEQVRKYLTISGFESFEDYAAFHITQIGDPFLSSTHLALGAKFVRYIPHSRLEDLRAMQGNAIVVYDAPVLPEADRKINLLGKPILNTVPGSEKAAISPEVLKVERKFGTNGIRGTGFNVDELRRMTTATAMELLTVWKKDHAGESLPVIGVAVDPRPQGAEGFSEEPAKKMAYARAIAEVLAAFGFKVRFYAQPVGSGHMIATTSAAYPAETRNFAVLMGTASHNEVVDPKSGELQFGLKVFMGNAPITDDFAARISDHINGNAKLAIPQITEAPRLDFDGAVGQARIEVVEDPVAVEFERLNGLFNFTELGRLFREKFPGAKIALNAMNGGTAKLAPAILKAMGFTDANSRAFNTAFMNDPAMESTVMGAVPDSNGKQVRFAPDPTRAWFRGKDYDAYVAEDPKNTISLLIDGDADRLVLESMGEISPNQIGPIVKYYLWNYLKDRDSRYVDARTVPTTSAMDLLDKALGISEPKVTDVGSKNFVPFLGDLQIGLEESGHIAFRYQGQVFFDHPVALMLLMMKMMGDTGKTWRELENEMWSFISERTGASRIETSRTGIGKDEGAEAYYSLLAKLPKDAGLRQEFGEALAKEFQAQGLDIKLEGFDTRAPGGVQFHLSSFVRVMPRKSGTDGSVRFYFESPSDKVAFLKKAGTPVMKKVLDQFVSRAETRTVIGVEELKTKIERLRKISTRRSLSVIDALTRQQMQEEIQALSEEDFKKLSIEVMQALIDWQIEALVDWQIELLTHEQRAWLNERLDELAAAQLGAGRANRSEARSVAEGAGTPLNRAEGAISVLSILTAEVERLSALSPEKRQQKELLQLEKSLNLINGKIKGILGSLKPMITDGGKEARGQAVYAVIQLLFKLEALEKIYGESKLEMNPGALENTSWELARAVNNIHIFLDGIKGNDLLGRELQSAVSRAMDSDEKALISKIEEFKVSSRGVTSPEMWRILHLTRNGAQAAKNAMEEMQGLTKSGVQDLGRDEILGLTAWHIQSMQDWHIRAMDSTQKFWLSARVDQLSSAISRAANRSEVRSLKKVFMEGFLGGVALLTMTAFAVNGGLVWLTDIPMTAFEWAGFLSAGALLCALGAAVKTAYVWWTTPFHIPALLEARRIGLVVDNLIRFSAERERMRLPPALMNVAPAAVAEISEIPSRAPYAVREIPNALFQGALFFNRSEVRQLNRGKVADIERNLWRQGFPPELLREQGESILNKSENTVSGILRGHFSKAYTNTWRDYNKILEEAGIDTVSESAKKENLEAFAQFIISIAGRMEQTIIQAAGRLLQVLTRREVERLGSVYLRGGVIWLQLLFWNKVGAANALEDIFREMGFYERNAWSFFLGERLNKVAAGNFLIEVAEIMPASQAVPQSALTPALRSETRTIRIPIQSAKPGDSIMGFIRSAVKPGNLAGREVVVILKDHEIDAAGDSFEALALSLRALKVSKMHEVSGIELRLRPLTPFSRSETRTASETIKRVADALSQEDAEWASFVLTSLKESESFMGLPAWIAAAIDRGLIATSVELDSAGWYKNNRTQLISELDSRSASGEQAKTSVKRSENRELSDESAPSVESQKTKSHRDLLFSDGKEAVLALFKELMENGKSDEAGSLQTSMELLSFTPRENETIISGARWVSDQMQAWENSRLHSFGSIMQRSETRKTPEQISSQGAQSIPDDKWLKTDKMLESTKVTILAGYGDRIFDRYQELVENGDYDAAGRIYSALEALLANPHGDPVLMAGVQKVIDKVHAFQASRRSRSGVTAAKAPKSAENRSETREASDFGLLYLGASPSLDEGGVLTSDQVLQPRVREIVDVLSPERIIVQEEYRFGVIAELILAKIRGLGKRAEMMLASLLGIPAYAEDRPLLEDQLSSEELERLTLLNASGPVALQTSRGDTVFSRGNEGTVFMDPEFLVIFAQHDGRGFYDMLQANEPAAGSMEEKPILTAGDAGIIGQIAAILENRNSGLEPSERANRTGIERLLREVIAVKPLEGSQAATINQLTESHKDMVTLLSSEDMLVGLNEGANFALKNRLAKENAKLVLRALFGRMKMLASQLKGVNPADQERLLKEFNTRQLGGLKKTQGGFVFENILLLVQSFLAQEKATAISA